MKDSVKGRRLASDGRYKKIRSKDSHRSQEALYKAACEATAQTSTSQATEFEPYRAPSSNT